MISRLLLVPIILVLLVCSANSEPLKWPDGVGKDLIKKNCLICHSGELIMGQRLSSKKWAKEVEKMAGWGSPIPENEKSKLVEYLTKNFSPDVPLPPPDRERFKL